MSKKESSNKFFRKQGNGLVFFWKTEFPDTWELNERNKLPYAVIRLTRHTSRRYAVQARLKMPRLNKTKQPTEYNNKAFFKSEKQALAGIEEEKKHIEKLLKDIMGSDFVLEVLPTEDALDYSIKGISTCIGCGIKYQTSKKYHRYCPKCWEKVGKKKED